VTQPVAAAPGGRNGLPLAVPKLYPIVVAVAYVGLLYLGLGVGFFSTVRVFLVAGLGAAFVGVVANLLMGDRRRGGLLALLVVFLAMFGTVPRAVAVLFILAAFVIVERVIATRRATRVPWNAVTLVGNAMAGVLVLTLVISGIGNGGWGRVIHDLAPSRASAPSVAPVGERPDIYVILLDGYARPDKMRDLFGFDDSPFIDELAQRGFDISRRSRSNYILTTLSVPSLLNMRHIPDLFDARPTGDGNYRALVRSFTEDSEVVRRMRGLGYESVAISSGFEEVIVRSADRVIDTGQVNEYELLMARETAIASAITFVAPTFFADQQRARVVGNLQAAADVARSPHTRPVFAFVHVPSPHGPILFGPNGEPVQAPPLDQFFEDTAVQVGLSRSEFGQRYVGQIQHLNGLVLDAVDAILRASPRPPVILIVSDHGSGSGLNWADLDHSDLDERSANLFAAYTPGHPALFPDDITLVNVFGRLLGGYYGITIPEQADSLYRWDDTNTHLVQVKAAFSGR
jgi:hypothetical protein